MENQDQNQPMGSQPEAPQPSQSQGGQQPPQMTQPQGGQQPSQQQPPTIQGTDQSKLWGILGYIVSPLFFVPLVTEGLKNNPYSRFHANQQAILLIIELAKYILFMFIPYGIIGWGIMSLISLAVNIVILVLVILGIINASKGEMKPLPLIGGIKII